MKIHHHKLPTFVALLAIGSGAFGSVAAYSATQELQQTEQGEREQKQRTAERTGQSQRAATDVPLPECLQDLTLSAPQQVKIKEIVRKTNDELAATWQRFSQSFMASVQTEALLASAIEDHLSDAQRKQVRDMRQKSMQQHRVTFERGDNRQSNGSAENTQKDSPSANGSSDQAPPQAKQDPVTTETSPGQPDLTVFGVALTSEQIAAADQIQERYMMELRKQNREIDSLHLQLVCLEAQKLEEIEQVLTADQLRQLRERRKNAPNGPAKRVGG